MFTRYDSLPIVTGTALTIGFSETAQVKERELARTITHTTDYEADILVLENACQELYKYRLLQKDVTDNLKEINAAWKSVRDGFTSIKNDITNAEGKISDEQ